MASHQQAETYRNGSVSVYFGAKNGKYPDGNQVIVQGGERRAVFDSPLVANTIGAEFDNADLVIQGHIHEDHTAGLHRLPEVPVYVHEGDIAAIQSWDGLMQAYGLEGETAVEMRAEVQRDYQMVMRPDAISYQDGHRWDLGGGVSVTAIHAPGHTSGHCVLLVEPEGVAFIGDIDLTGFGPYYADACSSLTEFRQTLAKLPDIPAKAGVTSHHRGLYTDKAEFLAAVASFSAKIDERERRILDLLEESPKTLDQLVDIRLLYPADYETIWLEPAERRTISRHLEEMLADGTVVDEGGVFAPA